MTRPQPRVTIPGPKRAGAEERPLQVRVDDGVPVGLGQLRDGAADVDAGVVDQDVDRAEGGVDLADQPVDDRPAS